MSLREEAEEAAQRTTKRVNEWRRSAKPMGSSGLPGVGGVGLPAWDAAKAPVCCVRLQ